MERPDAYAPATATSFTTSGWCNTNYQLADEVAGSTLDPSGVENTHSIGTPAVFSHDKITVIEAKPSLSKTNLAGPNAIVPGNGSIVNFKIDIGVSGGSTDALHSVVLTDTLPAQFVLVPTGTTSLTTSGGVTCSVSGQTISCPFGSKTSAWSDSLLLNVKVTGATANQVITNTASVDSQRAGGIVVPTISSSAGARMPSPANEMNISKAVQALDGPCLRTPTFVNGLSSFGDFTDVAPITDAQWKARCSQTAINGDIKWDLTLTNSGNSALSAPSLIDIMPHLTDGTEPQTTFSGTPVQAERGDGRDPQSLFKGTVQLKALLSGLPSGATANYTKAGVATINRDPLDASNQTGGSTVWCPALSGGTCPASLSEVTGTRVTFGTMNAGTSQKISFTLATAGNVTDDLYTNNFGARTTSLDLPMRSNDVSAMVTGLSLGNRVWIDTDKGGTRNLAETGPVSPVTLSLQDGAGNEIRKDPVTGAVLVFGSAGYATGAPLTVQTDTNGYYRFDNLPAGTYKVKVDTSNFASGGALFGHGSTADGTGNNADSGVGGPTASTAAGILSSPITLNTTANPTGEVDAGATGNGAQSSLGDAYDNLTVDFGFVPLEKTITITKVVTGGTLPGTAQFSFFATCDKPAVETRFPSSGFVTTAAGTPVDITGIPPDATCSVTEDLASRPTPPENFVWLAPSYTQPVGAGRPLTATVTNPLQEQATVSGRVYREANGNTADNGNSTDPGIAGVAIQLTYTPPGGGAVVTLNTTTNADGTYSFLNLPVGATNLTITETQPAQYGNAYNTPGSTAANGDNQTTIMVATLASGGSTNNNFAEALGYVSGKVYNQGTNAGFGGQAVTLTGTDAAGNPVTLSATTDATGAYNFANVPVSGPAGYTITQNSQPAGTQNGTTVSGTTGGLGGNPTATTSAISGVKVGGTVGNIPDTLNSQNNNFGETIGSSISGTVYVDSNNSGTLDAADATKLGGVAVQLIDPVTNNVIATKTTNPDGTYAFGPSDGVIEGGNYIVRETQPANYANGATNPGSAGSPGGMPNEIRINGVPLGGSLNNNFGEIGGTVAGKVHNSGTSVGYAGQNVTLNGTDAAGKPVTRSTVTDANGDYAFVDLPLSDAAGYRVSQPAQPTGSTNQTPIAGSTGGTPTNPTSTSSQIDGVKVTGSTPATLKSTGNNFPETVGTTISGLVYVDSDRNNAL